MKVVLIKFLIILTYLYFFPVYTFPFITFTALFLQIPSTARLASHASNEDSDNDCTSVSACAAQPESSTSAVTRKTSAQPKKKARHVDNALLDYLSHPHLSQIVKVPNERWE